VTISCIDTKAEALLQANPIVLGSFQAKYQLVIGKVQAPLQNRTSDVVQKSDRSDMEVIPLRLRRTSCTKVKSFHSVEWDNYLPHVTSPSQIFIRRPSDKHWTLNLNQESLKSSAEPSTTNGQSSATYQLPQHPFNDHLSQTWRHRL